MSKIYLDKLKQNYPHVIEQKVKYMLSKVMQELSPALLNLTYEEYINLIEFGLTNSGKLNYKQVASLLNNFNQLSFRAFLDSGFTLSEYKAATSHVVGHVKKWNRDMEPLLKEIRMQEKLEQARHNGLKIGEA